MSDIKDKKHEFDGETFKKVIAETMFKGSMSHAASKLIENFEEDQKEKALEPVHHVASIADKLMLLLSKIEESEDV